MPFLISRVYFCVKYIEPLFSVFNVNWFRIYLHFRSGWWFLRRTSRRTPPWRDRRTGSPRESFSERRRIRNTWIARAPYHAAFFLTSQIIQLLPHSVRHTSHHPKNTCPFCLQYSNTVAIKKTGFLFAKKLSISGFRLFFAKSEIRKRKVSKGRLKNDLRCVDRL